MIRTKIRKEEKYNKKEKKRWTEKKQTNMRWRKKGMKQDIQPKQGTRLPQSRTGGQE